MSLSIAFQISESHFLLKKVGKKSKVGDVCKDDENHQMSCYITLNMHILLLLKTALYLNYRLRNGGKRVTLLLLLYNIYRTDT